MYLYSVNYLKKEVEQTEYYLSKDRPTERLVLIDKTSFVIHSIVRGRLHHNEYTDYQPVPLHSRILKDNLGKEYPRIIAMLEELGYIQKDDKYLPKTFIGKGDNRKPSSMKYGLTPKAIKAGVRKVGVLSKRMENKINKHRVNSLNNYHKNDMHKQIIDSLTQVQFDPQHPTVLKVLEDIKGTTKDKEDFYNQTYTELQEVNMFTTLNQFAESDYFFYTQSPNVNRVYHYFTTIPTEYREALTLKDGSPMTEIDLKNAQPLIIGLNYLKGKANLTVSDEQLKEDLINGNLYKQVANQAQKNNDPLYTLYTIDYGEFKKMVLGEGLYFHYLHDLKKIKPMELYLMQLYPSFMQYIREKKLKACQEIGYKDGFKIISHEAQQIEARIFIERIYNTELPVPAIPIHDSLLVPTNYTDYYHAKLIESFKKEFPYLTDNQYNNLFRIK